MTDFNSRAFKKPRLDGYEKIDSDQVCLYCGATKKEAKKFYRVDRMKKMKLLLEKIYIGTSKEEWLCQTHYQYNKQLNEKAAREANGPQTDTKLQTADPEPNQIVSLSSEPTPPLHSISTSSTSTSFSSTITRLMLPSSKFSVFVKFGLLYIGLIASHCFGKNPLLNGSVMLSGVLLFLFLEGKRMGLFLELYLNIALRHLLMAVLITTCGAAASVGLVGLLDKNTRIFFVNTLTFDSLGRIGEEWDIIFSMPYRVKSVLNGAITLLSFVMTPVYCYYQEALFRGGTQNWIGAIFRSFLFGLMQYPLGQPVVACLVWSPIVGIFLSRHYFACLRTNEGNIDRAVEEVSILYLTYHLLIWTLEKAYSQSI